MEFELLARRHAFVRQRDMSVQGESIIEVFGAAEAPGRGRA